MKTTLFRWLGIALLAAIAVCGFSSRADAFYCYNSNTCLCQNPTITAGIYGAHCCYNVCGDGDYPTCGTLVPYSEYTASCFIGSICTIRFYNPTPYTWGPACGCEGPCPD